MFSLRALEQSDKSHFIPLLEEQFSNEASGKKENPSLQQLEQRCLNCLDAMRDDKMLILIAASQNAVLGYIAIQWLTELWTDAAKAFISNFYVAVERRENGIGSRLLKAAVGEVKKRNCKRLFLENSNSNVIYKQQFYLKRGWKERSDLSIFEFPFEKKT